MFAYCNNNPINKTDSSGMLPQEKIACDRINVFNGNSRFKTVHIPGRPWSDLSWEWSWHASPEDNPWYVRLISIRVSVFSISSDGISILDAQLVLMEQGLRGEWGDLSLLDLGVAEAELGFEDYTFSATAMATIWKPGVEFDCGEFTISIDANVGSFGAEIELGKNGVKIGGSAIFGLSISVGF